MHTSPVISRELKRLSTVTLSPVYAHFSESLAGLCTIRALRASDRFAAENEERVDINQRANFGSEKNNYIFVSSVTEWSCLHEWDSMITHTQEWLVQQFCILQLATNHLPRKKDTE